nr:PREDICTED: transcription termination factor 3, mitochondrial [Bemisia tabaci]
MVIFRCLLKRTCELNNIRTVPNVFYHRCSVFRTNKQACELNDGPNSSSSEKSSVSKDVLIINTPVPQDSQRSESSIPPSFPSKSKYDDSIPSVSLEALGIRIPHALDTCSENVSHAAPPLQPSVSFAAYVNDSPTLQELVKLDVQLWKFEKKPDICNYILSLDYDRDMKNHLLFLHKIGVPGENFGNIITKNPFIFKEDLDNLQIRVNYLESKKFTGPEIAEIIMKNPRWLSYTTQDIDTRLGFLQHTLNLTGQEVRLIAVGEPYAVTKDTADISILVFCLKEEMGFEDEDITAIAVMEPRLLTYKNFRLLPTFNEIHNEMGIPHDLIVKQPQALMRSPRIIRQRHLYLKLIKRDQYDPKKENYVSLQALVDGDDTEFCKNVAKTSVESYNTFLKTL